MTWSISIRPSTPTPTTTPSSTRRTAPTPPARFAPSTTPGIGTSRPKRPTDAVTEQAAQGLRRDAGVPPISRRQRHDGLPHHDVPRASSNCAASSNPPAPSTSTATPPPPITSSCCGCVFGERNFRNEIIWQRTSSHNDSQEIWMDVHDVIIFYSKRVNAFGIQLSRNTIRLCEGILSSYEDKRRLPI